MKNIFQGVYFDKRNQFIKYITLNNFYKLKKKNTIDDIVKFNNRKDEYKSLINDIISILPEIVRTYKNDLFSITVYKDDGGKISFASISLLKSTNNFKIIDLYEKLNNTNNFIKTDFLSVFLPIFKSIGGKEKVHTDIIRERLINE